MTSLDWFVKATNCQTIKEKEIALGIAKEFQKREILQFIKYGQAYPDEEIDYIMDELYNRMFDKYKEVTNEETNTN